VYEQIASNKRRTAIMLITCAALFTALAYGLGFLFVGGNLNDPTAAWTGFGVGTGALILALGGLWGSYYNSDKLVLRLAGAHPANPKLHAHLINVVEGLAIGAGLPEVPRVYVIDDPAPNAFATGRGPENAVIAVTTGLIEKLDRYELEGVVAHEVSHIVNRDILLQTVTAVVVGGIIIISDVGRRLFFYGATGGVGGRRRRRAGGKGGGGELMVLAVVVALMILAPIMSQIIRFAISRRREYLADASGAMLTRYPAGLANALIKISTDPEQLESASGATAHMYIVNPLRGEFVGLFSTHPPVEERVNRLLAMAGAAA